jgi:succinyl-CoA synthetase beta subunit
MVRLLEHQGKSLLKSFNVPVPQGAVVSTAMEAKRVAEKLEKSVAIKAQVAATGRLRAGGVRFANTPDEAEEVAEQILRSDIKGFVVKEVLVEEKLDVEKEFYAGVIVDDSYRVKAPVLILSIRGGTDIEQVSSEHPEDVGKIIVDVLQELSVKEVEDQVRRLGLSSDLASQLGKVAHGVYQVFRGYDARSAEVNPLVLTSDRNVYAADCHIVLDDASVSKHPELGIEYPREIGRPPTDLERLAWKIEEKDFRGIAYFVQMSRDLEKSDYYVGFHGIGGGGAMIGADALVRHGLKLSNYADTSGNPTASKVYRIVKTIFSQPNIAGYVLMGPVIANQEQWHHAHPLVRALREELASRPNFPVMILIAGNKEAEAIEILKQNLSGVPARIEVYGRDYVYKVDYIAERMRKLVDEYNKIELGKHR